MSITLEQDHRSIMAPPSKRQKTDEEPKVIDIATQSDLTLIVGDGITHKKVNFEVERSALRRASPVFNSMLDPNKPYKEGSAKEVPLPEDDPEAMEVLLRIAHLLFPTIPSTFDYQSLAAIAVLCDKYDCAEVVEPFTHSSFETLKPLVSESSCEAIEVLFAAWTFGDRATFEITMPDIILGSAVSDNKLLCYNGSESYLSICQRQLPQEVIGTRFSTFIAKKNRN